MSVFGFSTDTSSSGGDFMPVVKYDARAGRMFRTERTNDGSGWITDQVDITRSFKAVIDLQNLETGWLDFNTGGAPVFAVVKIGEPLPPKPTPNAKNGVRVIVKLSSECGGEKRIREMASSAKAFLAGLEELYVEYQKQAPLNPDKLPIITLEDTKPIKSGSGEKQSTNYQPIFKITGWAPRGDVTWSPKNGGAPAQPASQDRQAPPSTGATRVEPPKAEPAREMAMADDEDFG
jgi:hypothetical protein